MSHRRSFATALLIGFAATCGACTSPPRMWEKQISKALNARPKEVPAEYFEKLATDAATVDALAQLCGKKTGELGYLLPDYVSVRKAPDPNIVIRAFRFHRERLISENLHVAFPPGECWQRQQDYDAFIASVKAGEEVVYKGLEIWR